MGTQVYRWKKSLLCGYRECTRKDCCGARVEGAENVVEFTGTERPRVNKVVAVLLALTGLVACTTRLTPEGEEVRVTKQAEDVRGCKGLGFVESKPPYTTPKDAVNEMKNKAALLGGDTLFVTNYSIKANGVAYSCR